MEQDLLVQEMITGYRAYAEPEEFEMAASVAAPATSPFCGAAASFLFSYATTYGPGTRR
ncbi:hypothetical protein GCM10023321_77310 [Pseudonocardia eucalypti]|uniref:Uncharacterized protein n=1 Tax=Pseudonocardia eucalypti TaxID=648755 RepID=A0ABP9RAM3_9PSEU|nr:hypothetical protein [Pseudonocardia eucalypti]